MAATGGCSCIPIAAAYSDVWVGRSRRPARSPYFAPSLVRHRDLQRPLLFGGFPQDHGGFPCPPTLLTCRHVICARRKPPASSVCPFGRWRSTASTAPARATPSSVGGWSIVSRTSGPGSSPAPRRPLLTPALRPCCRPSAGCLARRPPIWRAADPCQRVIALGQNASSSHFFGLCLVIWRREMRRI